MASMFSRQQDIFAEAIGTFLLVAVGTSALTTINLSGEATTASVLLIAIIASSLTFGLLTRIFPRSNGFFNPAITIAATLDGHISWKKMPFMIVVQFLGAILASMVVALLYGSRSMDVNLGAVYPATDMGPMAAMVAEGLGTAIVAATALFVARRMNGERTSSEALLLGMGLAIGMMVSMGVSGGALNPARALAPQLVAANLQSWWVYVAGPLTGGILAVGLAKWFSESPAVLEQPARELETEPTSQPSQLFGRRKPEEAPTISPEDPQESGIVIHRDSSLEEKAAEALARLRQKAEEDHASQSVEHMQPAGQSEPSPVRFVDFNKPSPSYNDEQSRSNS